MAKNKIILISIIILAGVLRILFSLNLPVEGDESVSLLQSAGRATEYGQYSPLRQTVSIDKLKEAISYSPQRSVPDVLKSMRDAGIHPPIYYIMLHYVMKFFGSGAFTLRMFSAAMSVISVLIIYLTGKAVHSEKAGLLGALLLAVSNYSNNFGLMIRPYPLAMLLALVSVLLLVKLLKCKTLSIKNPLLWLYVAVIAAGFYTIYHFIFVFVFGMVFLCAAYLKNLRNLPALLFVPAGAFLLYLPWLPSFLKQLKFVRGGEFYFHSGSSLSAFPEMLFSLNFTETLPGTYSAYKFVIAACAATALIAGFWGFLKKSIGRLMLVSAAVYVIANFAADVIMNTHTIAIAKLAFLTVPVFLLTAAVGTAGLTRKCHFNVIAASVLIAAAAAGSVFGYPYNRRFIANSYHAQPAINAAINNSMTHDQKGLLLLPCPARRYTLPLAHAIKHNLDVRVISGVPVEPVLDSVENISGYDVIFIINNPDGAIPEESFTSEQTEAILNYLDSAGYTTTKAPLVCNFRGLEHSLVTLNRKSTAK